MCVTVAHQGTLFIVNIFFLHWGWVVCIHGRWRSTRMHTVPCFFDAIMSWLGQWAVHDPSPVSTAPAFVHAQQEFIGVWAAYVSFKPTVRTGVSLFHLQSTPQVCVVWKEVSTKYSGVCNCMTPCTTHFNWVWMPLHNLGGENIASHPICTTVAVQVPQTPVAIGDHLHLMHCKLFSVFIGV